MERRLVERAMHGHEEAFDLLVGRIGDGLHSVARRILRDMTLAQDATQQALLEAWRWPASGWWLPPSWLPLSSRPRSRQLRSSAVESLNVLANGRPIPIWRTELPTCGTAPHWREVS